MDEVLELDNQDKMRIDRNIRELRHEDIPYLKYMVRVPVNSLTEIISVKEIINKMLVDYLIACSANLMISSSVSIIGDLLDKINRKYNTDSILSLDDKTIILNIINKLYTLSELEVFSMRLESVNVCLWTLGFIEDLDSYNRCDMDTINRIIFKCKDYDNLLSLCNLRSKEQILSKFDLITRYYWAFREADKQELVGKVNESIVNIQNDTFAYITSYSYDSLRNKNIKIEYERDDIEFNFEIPTSLSFEYLSPKTKEIIALKNETESVKIVFTDLGEIEKEDFDRKVSKNIELFTKNGFKLLGKYEMYSTMLEEKIVRIVIQHGNIALNTYFIYVSKHLLRMDSLIEAYVDSSNYHETINSRNTNLDFDILFSIREVEY